MSNDVDHLLALDALDWKPHKTERIKAKSKLMFKLLNKMGPKSLTDLFTFKSEMTNYKLRNVESTLCYHSRVRIARKKVSCLTGHTFGIIYQPKLERATPSCPLKLKSLLTFMNTHIFE